MKKNRLTSACNITTGKLDSNAATENGIYPYFTCAPSPLRINNYAFDEDAILLAGNNASGNFHCQRYKGKFNAYQRTYVLTAKNGFDIDYIYYSLLLNLQSFRKVAQGSQTKFLTLDILDNFELIDISFEEQTRLAQKLKNIDLKITNNTDICVDLESMAKLLYDYWFVQFDFPDENGKPYKSSGGKMVWNEEFKREIPEGWEVGCFKDILTVLECGDRPTGGAEITGIPSVGAENIIGIGKYNFSSEKFVSEDYFYNMKSGVVHSWDVLMYKDGAGIGQVSMFGDGFPYENCAINSHVFILRSENNFYQDYLYITLTQEYVKKIIVALAMKAAQPGLNQPAVKSIPLIIPKNNTIEAFNKKVDVLFHKIFLCANENKQLTELRDFLLPMLMNGQVKIKE